MSNLRHPFYVIIFLFTTSLFGCKDDFDNYSTNPNHVLLFSTDTLSFDTILSTIGTSTHQFMVYNKNKEPLLISSVNLINSEQSGFRMNVNGRKGTAITDVRIEANDSLYVFVEATLANNGGDTPVLIDDAIVFTINGMQQKVILTAYGQDVVILRGVVIESSTVLPNNKPYLIYDSLYIKEGVELTVQEGTTFYIHNRAEIMIHGNIKVKGTIDKQVVFRGDRTDKMFTNVPYDRTPRQWGGIYFAKGSYDNEFDYVNVRNGTYGMYFEQSDPERTKLTIRNSVVRNVADTLIAAFNCKIDAENCEFSNSGGPLLYLNGGNYSFTHCTAANYMDSFWGTVKPTGKTVVLANASLDTLGKIETPLPLIQADFFNSIVYGDRGTGSYISIDSPKGSEEILLNYKFQNCLIAAKGNNDGDTIIDCIFDKSPEFYLIDVDEKNYDFRLDSISPAKNVADPVISQKWPYDMNGIYRLSDEGPDMGAYEWVPF